MRRLLSQRGMVIGVVAAAGLTGCGGGDNDPAARTNTPGAPSAVTADSAVTIVRTASDQMMSTHMVADLGADRGRGSWARRFGRAIGEWGH